MKLKNQVCNLELSKELKSLGVSQDSLFYHYPNSNSEEIKQKYKLDDYDIVSGEKLLPNNIKNIKELVLDETFNNTYSAFTVSELCLMLGNNYPSWSFEKDGKTYWIATVINKNENPDGKNITTANEFDRYSDTQADALATLLIATINVGHIKVKDVNVRLKEKEFQLT